MQKKTWRIILAAVLCLVVLGVTVWCVWSGVQSALPQQETVEDDLPIVIDPIPQDEVLPEIDENGNMIIDDNALVDPWSDAPVEDAPASEPQTSELPSDSESANADPDLSVSDEGWTGIY